MHSVVAEVQGLYGPFGFHERLLQKIWMRGDFEAQGAVLADGRSIEVLYPGRWNQLSGPDFRSARLRIGDQIVTGDVELHLRSGDWRVHGHAADSGYDGVVLHVVLFPTGDVFTLGGGGRQIPILALLPHLRSSLEEFAADDAVERMADRAASRVLTEFGEKTEQERWALLERQAWIRWHQKVNYAALRIRRLGWEQACHQTALEILGYRFNRPSMLRIAEAFPLGEWRRDPLGVAAQAAMLERDRWTVQGVRPANQPATRLRQYAEWVRRQPDWPTVLEQVVRAWEPQSELTEWQNGWGETRRFRKQRGLAGLRDRWRQSVVGEAVSGSRFDTLVCDGFLPLCDARAAQAHVAACWFHWFAGDLPPHLAHTLNQLGLLTLTQPLCHGVAQGLLGWWIEHERSAQTGRTFSESGAGAWGLTSVNAAG